MFAPGNEDNYSNLKAMYPEVFTNVIGRLVNFKHKIVLRDGVCPIRQRLRNVPINYRESLKLSLKMYAMKE